MSYVANATEMTRRSVVNHIQRLAKAGFLEIEHRSHDGAQLTNIYHLAVGGSELFSPPSEGHSLGVGNEVHTEPSIRTVNESKTKVRPSVYELRAYASSIGFTDFDPQAFIDHYEANGWKVGRTAMKDWRATVRTWKRRAPEFKPRPKRWLNPKEQQKHDEAEERLEREFQKSRQESLAALERKR
jgi:hypothetical protein